MAKSRRNTAEVEIPEDLQSMLAEEKPLTQNELVAVGQAIETRKQEAILYRGGTGIEDTWALCEDSYCGIDEFNRHEFSGVRMIKALTLGAPLTTNQGVKGNEEKRSTAFVRLTSRYVDAGAAKIGEILLPIDDKAFSFTATPVPDLIKGLDDSTQLTDQQTGLPMTRAAQPHEMPQMASGAPPPALGTPPPQVPLTTRDIAQEAIDLANTKAKKAEDQIFDWMVECQHQREMRKVIFDSARIGVGVVKGPIPDHRRRMAVTKGEGEERKKLTVKEEVVPIDKWVDPWNIFPDPACGENIRDGDYIFERDYMSEKQIRKLIGLPGFLEDQINKAIKAGPPKITKRGKNPNDDKDESKHPYEVWYYYGTMKRADFKKVNPNAAEKIDTKKDLVYAVITMIGDIVVRGTINPLDSGDFPYHAVPWIRRPRFWAGVGVAEQLVVPQRIVNASTRALLNNAGITAGPQIVINRKIITPADGSHTLTANKIWYMSEDGITDDVQKAFYSFDINNTGDELGKIIEYGMRLAEECTSIPLITQGMSGKTTPETFGAAQLQNNNANQLLRSIGYCFDDYVTEPLVHQYYEYLLLSEDVDDDCKGDFSINAHGSIAMVERSIQNQTIMNMTPIATPDYGVDKKKWFSVLAKSQHLDPTMFQYTKEEQAKIDSQPPPKAPAVQVAEIKAQTAQAQMQADQAQAQAEAALEKEIAQLTIESTQAIEKVRNETAQIKVRLDTDRDTVYAQAEASRAQAEFQHKMSELNLKKELAIMQYANQHQMSMEAVKAKLADTAMKLQTQKELAAMDTRLQVHMHHTPSATDLMKPPAQAPGKAPNGKAFSQV